jgi:hypothetical protein
MRAWQAGGLCSHGIRGIGLINGSSLLYFQNLLFSKTNVRQRSRAIGAKVPSPGERLGGRRRTVISALMGRNGPAPFQGAQESTRCRTQGVALGWPPAALSAPGNVAVFKGRLDCFSDRATEALIESHSIHSSLEAIS